MAFLPAVAVALSLAAAQGGSSPVNDIPAKYRTNAPAAGAVVARVNGLEIKAGDVEALLWDWRGFDAIQDLISYQMIKAEAQKERVDVSEADVEARMQEGLKQLAASLPAGKSAELALLEQGFSKSRLYLRYRTEALLDAIVLRSYKPTELVKVSTLVFRPDNDTAAAWSVAIKKADDAYERLKKGEAWETVLKSTTNNEQALKTKGLLGWRDLGAFPAPVKTEIGELKAGGITHPAKTENGLQIFRLEAAGKDAPAAEQAEMKKTYMMGSRVPLLDRLRKQTTIERLYPPIPGLNPQKDGN